MTQYDSAAWQYGVDEFFITRLHARYFEPIDRLQQGSRQQGEGFAVMAIQCCLVEFLESIVQGKNYTRKKKPGKNEYSGSGAMFKSFLTNRDRFHTVFTNAALATSFYVGVRCAILHEAATGAGWRVHAGKPNGPIADTAKSIVYYRGFRSGLDRFVTDYRASLLADRSYQDAFIRKFDHLCKM